jgi:hypothetical protein
LQLFFRWRSASVLTLAASLFPAAPALAGTFTVDHDAGSIAYQAGAGEANVLTIDVGQNQLRLQDRGVPAVGFTELGATASCSQMSTPDKYKCPTAGLSSVTIALADGADGFDAVTSALPTTVTGGTGGKTVTTGSGDDKIFMANGDVDSIACGAGLDSVVVDTADTVDPDCETVTAGAAADSGTSGGGSGAGGPEGPAPDSSGAPAPGALATALGLEIAADVIKVPTPRKAIVPLRCAEDAQAGCRGEVIISLPGKRRGAGDRVVAARGHYTAQSKRRRIGRRRFKLAAGESVKLPVRIALRGHYSRVSSRNRRRRATLKVVHRDAANKVIGVQTRSVTLNLQKRKWSRQRRGR